MASNTVRADSCHGIHHHRLQQCFQQRAVVDSPAVKRTRRENQGLESFAQYFSRKNQEVLGPGRQIQVNARQNWHRGGAHGQDSSLASFRAGNQGGNADRAKHQGRPKATHEGQVQIPPTADAHAKPPEPAAGGDLRGRVSGRMTPRLLCQNRRPRREGPPSRRSRQRTPRRRR